MLTIAVDAMGGDLGPRIAFRACRNLLKSHPDIRIILPLEAELQPQAHKFLSRYSDRVDYLTCSGHVRMDEHPRNALRQCDNLTMGSALNSLAAGDAQGVLSIGNTGSLLLLARHYLGMAGGMERPALATQLPSRGKPLLLLDLGANIAVSAQQLVQLALMAIAWYRASGFPEPQIGLLNIGSEPGKGPEFVRQAGEMMEQQLGTYYHGFVEGDRLFDGYLDAVVCDGYSGNIVLKTTEGLIDWMTHMMASELGNSKTLKWMVPLWKASIRRLDRKVSPSRHGGAMLLGVNGHVAKTHGKSDERTFRYALEYLVGQIRSRDQQAFVDEYQALSAGLQWPDAQSGM
ncbi:MAG: hypothetical protein CMI00_01570 [Oceanospirillaceae bacterium]|nr:hypothetical protein [Oceanospirillaceae bacterium]|tara:strand:+ start:10613 stop:11647 length:1035 start_codon:yes stop_codon:yes gene_type:complete